MSVVEKIKQVFENYYKMNKTTRAFDELYQDVLKILEDYDIQKLEKTPLEALKEANKRDS